MGVEAREEAVWRREAESGAAAPSVGPSACGRGSLVAAWLWFLFIGPGNHIPGVFEALIFTK